MSTVKVGKLSRNSIIFILAVVIIIAIILIVTLLFSATAPSTTNKGNGNNLLPTTVSQDFSDVKTVSGQKIDAGVFPKTVNNEFKVDIQKSSGKTQIVLKLCESKKFDKVSNDTIAKDEAASLKSIDIDPDKNSTIIIRDLDPTC